MKSSVFRSVWTPILASAVLASTTLPLAADTPPPPPPPPNMVPPPPPPMPSLEGLSDETLVEALTVMGFAMGQGIGLDIGFSEEELSVIFAGMRRAATGGEQPERFQELMPYAQAVYMDKREAKRIADEAKAEQEAAENIAKAKPFLDALESNPNVKKTESGLYYEIIEPGSDKVAGPRDRVRVLYRGTLIDGTEFDASQDRDNPASFSLHQVVPGFGEGLRLIGEGGRITLYIPSELGYGNSPRPGGKIKPGDTLIFDVELLEVVAAPPPATRAQPNRPVPPPPPNMRPPGPPPNITPPPPPTTRPPSPPPAARPEPPSAPNP